MLHYIQVIHTKLIVYTVADLGGGGGGGGDKGDANNAYLGCSAARVILRDDRFRQLCI